MEMGYTLIDTEFRASIFRSGCRTQGEKHCNKQIAVEFCLEQAVGASDRNVQQLMSEPGLHHNDASMQLVFCQYGSGCEQLWFTPGGRVLERDKVKV